jgi:hypothetical protein
MAKKYRFFIEPPSPFLFSSPVYQSPITGGGFL